MAAKITLRTRAAYVFAAWPNESLEEFAERMDMARDGAPTRSGVPIGPVSAMGISAFFCGVNLIMGAIASMKYVFYRRTGDDSRDRFRDHSLYGILHDRANPYMTAHQWKRASMGHLLLWGNAFSIMRRDPYRGTIIEVEKLLHPSNVKTYQDKGTGRLSYEVYHSATNHETLTREGSRFMFHIPGPGFNGVTGFSLLSLARESMGLTAAMEQYGATYFGKGIHAGGFLERPLEAPKITDKAARDRLIESLQEATTGIDKRGYGLLEEGMKFNPNTIPLEDAQFLTSRTFQIDEVARWVNLSPARLKELSRATFSNIEHLQIMDLQDCFLPWCELIEAETNAQLIEPDLQDKAFAEFNMDSLLRADTKTRAEALAIKRQWGVLTGDEWRAMDNQNPLPDGSGKKAIVPANYTTMDKLGQAAPAPAAPQPSPSDPAPADPAPAKAIRHRLDIRVGQSLRRTHFENISYDDRGVMVAADKIEEDIDGEEPSI